MPSFKLVNSLYDQSYSEILEFKDAEPISSILNKYLIYEIIDMFSLLISCRFTETLVNIRKRHADIVSTLAQVHFIIFKIFCYCFFLFL